MNTKSRKKTEQTLFCLSMFLLLIGITFYPRIIPNEVLSANSSLLLPLMYMLEFCCIFPLYMLFFRKLDDMGKGVLSLKQFLVFLLIIVLAQFAGGYIMDIRNKENWMVEQEVVKGAVFWINFILLVFVVPIYEEIVFRGCLLTALFSLFRGNVYIASLVTSALFAFMHTQYTDIRTLIILYIVSVILIVARILSKGLLMPILLHIAMNGIVLGVVFITL
ncbi:CPBP family intramembrane glutamic endopeptidase [Rahnella aceris]|nr:type II CAAX endopeptidase family protein [Rahnella aceris]